MNDRQREAEAFRAALGPGPQCPPIEELSRLVENPGSDQLLVKHVATCPHCRTELKLMQMFESGEVRPDESAAVRQVVERLQAGRRAAEPERLPWWRWLAAMRMRPVILGMATLLVVAGVGLQLRQSAAPTLHRVSGDEVLRAHDTVILAPAGDVSEAPREIRWQATTGAVRYHVRLLEVDGTELWNAETDADHIAIPADVTARIVPAKTLLVRVSALDAASHKLAESEPVRFRVLQNLYTH